MLLQSFSTAHKCWVRLSQEFTAKTIFAQNDLQQAFFDMCCPKNGDIQQYLQSLSHKKEELAAAGVTVSDTEYQQTILWGIPDNLARFASQLLALAQLSSAAPAIDIDNLILHICEEAERTHNWRNCGSQNQGGGKKDQQPDEAMAATTPNASKPKHHKGKCHHWKGGALGS
jgi:gag-polypeptide of LTR copia-type